LRWLQEAGVDLKVAFRLIEENSTGGNSLVGLAVNGTLRGLIILTDTLKSGSREVVAKLQRQGLKIYLLTGDLSQTASVIAKQAGIDSENVFAEVRPEQKAERVKKLQAQGERVAFVGDGINDAPALEQADLGIAVGRASDVAREAADIILLKSEIEAVPEALGLARATLRTIKQNLFWAFFYNARGVPDHDQDDGDEPAAGGGGQRRLPVFPAVLFVNGLDEFARVRLRHPAVLQHAGHLVLVLRRGEQLAHFDDEPIGLRDGHRCF